MIPLSEDVSILTCLKIIYQWISRDNDGIIKYAFEFLKQNTEDQEYSECNVNADNAMITIVTNN